jgi:EmrB/QacA subfamily drug resistance transporter
MSAPAPPMTAPPVVAAPQTARRNLVLAVMCGAVVMVVAGVSMLATAHTEIASDLQASQSQQQWIVDGYALPLAALLLPAGALGDRYGRRGALALGIAIFGGASLLAAAADTPNQLIALRVVMGIGAALLMPGTLSTITSVFPDEERAKAVGVWAGFATMGGTLGLLVSGALLEGFAWGSIFLVTAAVAAVLLVGVVLVVPSTRASERVGFDPAGSVISALGIGAVVLGIIEGPERGWTDPLTVTALLGGVLLLAAFVAIELRATTPLLDPRLFRARGFATGSTSLFLQFFAMFGFFFVSLQFLQLGLGYSTFEAALALTPMALLMIPLSAVSGTLAERYGHKLLGGAGLAISALGFLAFATLDSDSGFLPFLLATLLIGIGTPLAVTPATNAIVASLPREKQGVASAVNDVARELGAAFGVAVLGSAFNVGYRGELDGRLGGLPTDVAEQAREAPAIALRLAADLDDRALADAARDAFTSGMRSAVLVGAGLLVIGAIYVWVRGASGHPEATVDVDLDLDPELDAAFGESALVPAIDA